MTQTSTGRRSTGPPPTPTSRLLPDARSAPCRGLELDGSKACPAPGTEGRLAPGLVRFELPEYRRSFRQRLHLWGAG